MLNNAPLWATHYCPELNEYFVIYADGYPRTFVMGRLFRMSFLKNLEFVKL